VIAGAALLALAALLATRGRGSPVAWDAPAAPRQDGAYARNHALTGATRLPVGAPGPEDIAFGPDGALYTGVADGRILRRAASGGAFTPFTSTGGRPLGLRFGPGGTLYVADAERGLLAVDPTGTVEVLADGFAGQRFRLADDLDVAADGTVYFTDASARVGLGESVRDVVEQHGTGRLFSWRRGEGLKRITGGFFFANGVALTADARAALVVETARYRVQRCVVRGTAAGTCTVLVENLPGFPDGITAGSGGRYWIALVSPRNALLDRLHPHPKLKRVLLGLPDAVRPGPRAYGYVLAVDEAGAVLHTLQDPSGQQVAFATNAVEHQGHLYLGSLERDWVAAVRVP
jgi:sugar lactone lactonase YvrE